MKMVNRKRGPVLKGKISKVDEKPEGVMIVVDTVAGPAHILMGADAFRNLWRARDGKVVGYDVEVVGRAPRQTLAFAKSARA